MFEMKTYEKKTLATGKSTFDTVCTMTIKQETMERDSVILSSEIQKMNVIEKNINVNAHTGESRRRNIKWPELNLPKERNNLIQIQENRMFNAGD